MIQNTRLATPEEKALIIRYLEEYTSPQALAWPDWGYEDNTPLSYNDWQSASFIIIEVKDMEERIVVVNQVSKTIGAVLDILTAHYLLHHDNTVSDLSNSDFTDML